MKTSLFILIPIIFLSLQCATRKYISIQNAEVYIEKYGAIPNDGIDDAAAIQHAIEDAIASHSNSVIIFGPGIYDINSGIVIAHRQEDGEYFAVTLHLRGHGPAFDSDQRIGASTVFRSTSNGFTLAIQKGRSCSIENIVFESTGPMFNQAKEIMNASPAAWGIDRIHPTAPHCAIAIDPFCIQVPALKRYPDYNAYYTNSSNGGSSLISITGCAFSRYYIAIANNPSIGIRNGDNISIENCYVTQCHTFWASGQTQSRTNTIEKIYSLMLNTFVSGVEIGEQQGIPPFISNVNIAGFCKYVFNFQTGFAGVSMRDSHLESVWSLGIAITNSVSIQNCQIQFYPPGKDMFSPPFQLLSKSVIHFSDCSIEYFSDCAYLMPILFYADAVEIEGGWVEAGVVVANGMIGESGRDLHSVTYDHVFLKCQQDIAGENPIEEPVYLLSNHVFIGGTSLLTSDGSSFTNRGPTYTIIPLGSLELRIDTVVKKGTFITSNPGILKIGDNLFTDQPTHFFDKGLEDIHPNYTAGYISAITGQLVTVVGIPQGLQSGILKMYIVEYPSFTIPLWGDVTINNDTIKNVLSQYADGYPKAGTRLNVEGLIAGTYVTGFNVDHKEIYISTKADKTQSEQWIRNTDYVQEVFLDEWPADKWPLMLEGTLIHLQQPHVGSRFWTTASKGIPNTSYQPSLKSIDQANQ